MSVRATSDIDLRIVGKYLLIIVLLFSGCNHVVRQLAYSPPSAPTGLNDWSLFHTGPVITGMNNTRQGIGSYFDKATGLCPKTGYVVCKTSINGLRIGLGLH